MDNNSSLQDQYFFATTAGVSPFDPNHHHHHHHHHHHQQQQQQKDQLNNPENAFYINEPSTLTFSQHSPPFETNFFYNPTAELTIAAAQAQANYTPSYGSPQSSIYESIDSSDYEPSDGYSSTGSGLSSPYIPTDIFVEDEYRRNSLQFSDDDILEYAEIYNTFTTTDFRQPQNFDAQVIKMENPYRSLKLDTNVSNLDNSTTNMDLVNDNNNPSSNDPSTFLNQDNVFDPLTPNTLNQCLHVNDATGAALGGPLLSFIPATPISPTKAQAIADSCLYGVLNPSSTQLVSSPIMDHIVPSPPSPSSSNGDSCNTISKSVSQRHTNDSASNSAQKSTSHSHQIYSNTNKSGLSSKSTVTSTVSTTPTHHHRSHRKALPADMADRLHTMNLAPPKPPRKSKTTAPFHCPYEDCPKTFTRQYNLKSHLRTHTDERPFLCGFQGCTRAFARQHDRKRHYNLHLGFKPHVCSHCGRAFARLDALNRHLRSDSGAPCAQATLPNGGAKKFKPVNM